MDKKTLIVATIFVAASLSQSQVWTAQRKYRRTGYLYERTNSLYKDIIALRSRRIGGPDYEDRLIKLVFMLKQLIQTGSKKYIAQNDKAIAKTIHDVFTIYTHFYSAVGPKFGIKMQKLHDALMQEIVRTSRTIAEIKDREKKILERKYVTRFGRKEGLKKLDLEIGKRINAEKNRTMRRIFSSFKGSHVYKKAVTEMQMYLDFLLTGKNSGFRSIAGRCDTILQYEKDFFHRLQKMYTPHSARYFLIPTRIKGLIWGPEFPEFGEVKYFFATKHRDYLTEMRSKALRGIRIR
jgi:hypothetical protein